MDQGGSIDNDLPAPDTGHACKHIRRSDEHESIENDITTPMRGGVNGQHPGEEKERSPQVLAKNCNDEQPRCQNLRRDT